MIRILVNMIHAETEVNEAYESELLNIHFDEGCYDHTCLAASNVVRGLQSMYAGDHVRVRILVWDVVKFESEGTMGREDEIIEGAARTLESGKLNGIW